MVFDEWATDELLEVNKFLDAAEYGDLREAMLIQHVKQHGTRQIYDNDGATLLHFLARGGNLAVCRYFVENGGAVDPRSKTGATPLDEACSFGCYEIVAFLISNGADVNNQTVYGYTPLMRAAYYEYPDLINVLLDNGADRSIVSATGKTAINYAEKMENERCVDLLKKEKEHLQVPKEIQDSTWLINAENALSVCKTATLAMDGRQRKVLHGWGDQQSTSTVACMVEQTKDKEPRRGVKDGALVVISQLKDLYEF